MISGEISAVPYGADRLFEIMCYNSSEEMNYYGFTLIDINSFAPTVEIVLNQVDSTADVTIIGTFADTVKSEEKIVFSANWSGSYNIYIMDVNGTNICQLTESDVDDKYPQLSPDRSKVSFHRYTPEGPICYAVDVETLELEHFYIDSYRAQCISWHPTENSIVFHSNYNGTCDIFKYNMDTEIVTPVIVDSLTNWVPVYSANGDKLLYYAKYNNQFRAYIANADGTNPIYLNSEGHADERLPHMNPEYNNLVVFSGRNYGYNSYSQFGLFITNLENGEINILIENNGINESWPDWSPDGEKVIYERNSGGNYGIYVINKDRSGHKALLDTESGNEINPHWR
jgi:TolB protein